MALTKLEGEKVKKLFIAVAVTTLAGCATNPSWHWEKPDSDQQQFSMDSGQCRAQGISGTGGMITTGTAMIMNSCMQGRGWYQVPNN
jgi:hypothetical protein